MEKREKEIKWNVNILTSSANSSAVASVSSVSSVSSVNFDLQLKEKFCDLPEIGVGK